MYENDLTRTVRAKRGSKMMTAAGLLVGAVAGLMTFLAMSQGVIGPFGGPPVERQIEQMAKELNADLPMQVDAHTRWDRVEPEPGKKAYSYIYTIDIDLTEADKQTIREMVTRQALAEPKMQATFAAGVTVWYKYFDSSGKKVLEFPVKK